MPLPTYTNRLRRLEKRLKPLLGDNLPPGVTDKDIENFSFLLWHWELRDGRPTTPAEEDLARPQFQQLPEADQQHWRRQALKLFRHLHRHPEIIDNVLKEIADEWFPEDDPY